jgi:hypothetical protein
LTVKGKRRRNCKEGREIRIKKRNMVGSDLELHWKKEEKSDEGRLLIALALFLFSPFFFTTHSLHSFRGGWRVSDFEEWEG